MIKNFYFIEFLELYVILAGALCKTAAICSRIGQKRNSDKNNRWIFTKIKGGNFFKKEKDYTFADDFLGKEIV